MKKWLMAGLLTAGIVINAQAGIKVPDELEKLPSGVRQAVVVEAAVNEVSAALSAWEMTPQGWIEVLPPVDAVVGRNGLAPERRKREGDGRTPTGIFDLRRAFGAAAKVSTGLTYHAVGKYDYWVDDPVSPLYNQWVSGEEPGVSRENLFREDGLYNYAIVVEYNTNPVIAGDGSAIFLHIWRGPAQPTAGCIATDEEHLRQILEWLDNAGKPVIIIRLRPGSGPGESSQVLPVPTTPNL